MKLIIAFATVLVVAAAAPQQGAYKPYSYNGSPLPVATQQVVQPRPVQKTDESRNAVILRYDSDNIGVEGYNYAVETSDGQSKSEEAQLINAGTDAESLAVSGQYSYTGPDGVLYTVTYIADANGFQPQGAHLPKAL